MQNRAHFTVNLQLSISWQYLLKFSSRCTLVIDLSRIVFLFYNTKYSTSFLFKVINLALESIKLSFLRNMLVIRICWSTDQHYCQYV